MKTAAIACLAILFSSGAGFSCGIGTDCRIGQRIYRIAMPGFVPEGETVGAILFAHGYRGRADRVMKNKNLLKVAADLGVALIAVKSAGDDWSIPGAPQQSTVAGTDELAYFENVIEDATNRFPIDGNRLLVTGFSAGGMMVWNLACYRGDLFAGFAPISGTFWRPVPQTCPGAPVNLFHYHGTRDPIVPMQGRPIGPAHQGNVETAVRLLKEAGRYREASNSSSDPGSAIPGLTCHRSRANDENSQTPKILDVCLHDGKHAFRASFIKRSWTQLQAIGAL